MKHKFLYILITLIIIPSCSSITKNSKDNKNPELTLQTIAAFKSAEQINGNNWQLIFRKLDDCQYILFLADIEKLNSLKDNLIISSDNTYSINSDFVNSMFRINYTEENLLDNATGENAVVNRLKEVMRYPGDRFAAAGFEDDTSPDDFILSLKKNVSSDQVQEIAKMISFPLEAVIRNKRLKIKDPDAFTKDYNNIFNKRVKNAILSQPLADVQASPKGLIIGKGEIVIKRFDDKIFITSVNSY